MKLVFLSHTAPNGVLTVGSHHLVREFARRGHDVAHVATPVSLLHALRPSATVRARLRLSLSSPAADVDGVTQVVPLTLAPVGRRGRGLDRLMFRLWRRFGLGRASVRALAGADAIIVDQPLLADMAFGLGAPIVYRPTDEHFDPRQLEREGAILSRAAGLVAASPHVLAAMRETHAVDPALPDAIIENGVEFDRFSGDEGERAGFVYLGAVDARFDWETVVAIARRFPNEPVVIAGPVTTERDDLPENVRLLGAVPYVDAPGVLRAARVGLLPLSADPGNNGRSPMKYYEYLAAGLSVLATSSPALRARSVPGVELYDTEAEALASARTLLSAPSPNALGAEEARSRDWSSNAERLEAFIRDVL